MASGHTYFYIFLKWGAGREPVILSKRYKNPLISPFDFWNTVQLCTICYFKVETAMNIWAFFLNQL